MSVRSRPFWRVRPTAGVGYIDTAPAYGDAEVLVGRHLATRPQSAHRHQDAGVDGAVRSKRGTGSMSSIRLAASLDRLKVDAVHGLLVHQSGDLAKPGWQHLVDAMAEARSRGWTSRIGASIYNADQLALVESRFRPELVQLPLNVLDRRPIVSGTLARLKAAGVEVHARSVFLQGLLLMEPNELPEFFAPVRQNIVGLRGLWRKRGLSALDGCLAFALQRPEIDAVIVGVNCLNEFEQIEAAVASYAGADVDSTSISRSTRSTSIQADGPCSLTESITGSCQISRAHRSCSTGETRYPVATQTFSKGPNQWVRGVSPHYLVRGEGAWVWDADGNKYLDYLMALGPIILGYGNRRVNEAVTRQVADGPVFSQMHPLEVEVAEMLVDLIPCAEMVRFAKNGSDVTTGAVRAARAYTGRDHVAFCGYHGWHDWYIGTTTRNKGVPAAVSALSHGFIYNDIDSLKRIFAEHALAAVVMEPVGVEEPKPGFLQACVISAPQTAPCSSSTRSSPVFASTSAAPGAVWRHAGPCLLRQGHGERFPACRRRRQSRSHDAIRRNLLLRHLRRRRSCRWPLARRRSRRCRSVTSSRTTGGSASSCTMGYPI